MLLSPENMTFEDKTFSMIIYGSPGIGKTTLALSAPSPVLLDFDKGVARVKAYHRTPTIKATTYEEVLNDMASPEMQNFKTVVIDTGGSFVTFLQDWAMRTDPKTNCQKNGAISLKGFGAVKAEFQRFTNWVRDTLNKNIIYVFHSNEQTGTDGNTQQRLLCEGAVRNIVWQPCDFGGYMQMIGNQRTIAFTPDQEYFAKGCFGIEGIRKLKTLKETDANDFISKLFEEARVNIAKESEVFAPIREKYEAIIAQAAALIEQVDSTDAANALATAIPKMDHALTSLTEIRTMFSEKCSALGYVWDKATKQFKEREAADSTVAAEEGQA